MVLVHDACVYFSFHGLSSSLSLWRFGVMKDDDSKLWVYHDDPLGIYPNIDVDTYELKVSPIYWRNIRTPEGERGTLTYCPKYYDSLDDWFFSK